MDCGAWIQYCYKDVFWLEGKGGNFMNINQFAKIVAMKEGKKKQVNIAQIKEILKVVRGILLKTTGKDFYKLIREV